MNRIDHDSIESATGGFPAGSGGRMTEQIFSYSRDAVLTRSRNEIITGLNQKAEQLLGYTGSEVIGRPFAMIFPTNRTAATGRVNDHKLRDERFGLTECERVKKSGERVAVMLASCPLNKADGADSDVLVVVRDIDPNNTFDNEVRNHFRESDDFKRAVDHSAAVSVTDANGQITYINDKFCEVSKFSPAELIGMDHRVVNSGFHSKEFMTSLWETIASGRTWRGEICNRAKDGSSYWLDTTIEPCITENGTKRYYIAIQFDVSGRKARELEIEELARANAELEEFAELAAHDLKEPLRIIVSFSKLFLDEYGINLDEKGGRYLAYSIDSAKRMQSLIDGLLRFALVTTRGGEIVRTDSQTALRRVLDSRLPDINRLRATINTTDLPHVNADEGQLMWVFENLIDNSLKFAGGRAPEIAINASRHDGEWIFSVSDNGIGVDAKHKHRIFQIFQKLHKRSEYEGDGIGLALVKRIINRHKGRIWAESEPGMGTTIFFTLPEPGGGE